MERGWRWGWAAVMVLLAGGAAGWAEGPQEAKMLAMTAAPGPGGSYGGGPAAAVELVRPEAAEDPCTAAVVSQPAGPMWTAGAQPTQCGVMENDLGWRWVGLGRGARQRGLTSAERYGINRRLDITVVVPLRMEEADEGEDAESGVTDLAVSLMYEFQQQGRRVPAMAVSYGMEIPTANPATGFGSGYADHAMAFLASRDVRALHFDFNVAGTMEGGPAGYDGAMQSGLVMSVPVRGVKNLGWLLETDGGSQPGTVDRFGQSLTGLTWAVRPNLVFDTAYARAWTAGSPRQQFTVGVTWAHRMGWLRVPPGAGRWLGR